MHRRLGFFSEASSNSTSSDQSDPEHNIALAIKVILIFLILPSFIGCIARRLCRDLPPLPDIRRTTDSDSSDDEFEAKAPECVIVSEPNEIELARTKSIWL